MGAKLKHSGNEASWIDPDPRSPGGKLSADTAFESESTQVPTISFEFFPPKDAEGEQKLWQAIDELQEFKPDFVSMTYGAGGGTRGPHRTHRL